MVTIKIPLDEQTNYEVKADDSTRGTHLGLEMSSVAAINLWLRLEEALIEEGLIWEEINDL